MLDWVRNLLERILQLEAQAAPGSVAWAIGVAVTATLLLVVLWGTQRFVLRRLGARLSAWQQVHLRGIRFQSQELLSEEDTQAIAEGSLRMIRYSVQGLLLYFYINAMLHTTPYTAGVGTRMVSWAVDSAASVLRAIVDYLPSLIFLIVIFFFGRFAIHLVRLVFNGIAIGRIRLPGFDAEWAQPTFKITRVLIVVFLIVLAFPYLPGSDSPAFQAVSLFLGVLLSLGSSGAVANVVAGIVLTYTRAFQMGDRVRIADATGDVIDKTMFVTRVRTVKNTDIVIPNAMVLSNHIINFSAQATKRGLILHTTITLGYDVPHEQVEALLVEAALATEAIEADPAPYVLQTALDDFYVHYELNASTRNARRMGTTYSDLHRQIQNHFHAAGIEIASAHLSALRDGNHPQIPDDYLPKNYEPKGFRVLPLPFSGAIKTE